MMRKEFKVKNETLLNVEWLQSSIHKWYLWHHDLVFYF